MVRKRPCAICRRWFQPHPRAGDRQRVCGAGECQLERHRRACEAWRRENPDYDRDARLREVLRRKPSNGAADPLLEVDWDRARDAVGLEAAVLIEETGKVLRDWARDAVIAQGHVITKNPADMPAMGRETASAGAPASSRAPAARWSSRSPS